MVTVQWAKDCSCRICCESHRFHGRSRGRNENNTISWCYPFFQPQEFHRNIKTANNTVLSCNHSLAVFCICNRTATRWPLPAAWSLQIQCYQREEKAKESSLSEEKSFSSCWRTEFTYTSSHKLDEVLSVWRREIIQDIFYPSWHIPWTGPSESLTAIDRSLSNTK